MKEIVTVIVCAFNHERFAEEALRSVYAQTYRPIELIVCDDASKDATALVLDKVLRDLPLGMSLRRIRHDENHGLASTLNEAISMASARVIVFAAADDVMEPCRVEHTLCNFRNPAVRFVHTAVRKIDASGNFIEKGSGTRPVDQALSLESHLTISTPPIIGASCAYHAEVFKFFGPIDLKIIQEDIILPIRALLLGEGYFIGQELVRYRTHADNVHSIAGLQDSREMVRRQVSFAPNRQAITRQMLNDARQLAEAGRPIPAMFMTYLRREVYYSETEQLLISFGSRTRRAWEICVRFCMDKLPWRSAIKLAAIYVYPDAYSFLLRIRARFF